jgi:hypothetical protein
MIILAQITPKCSPKNAKLAIKSLHISNILSNSYLKDIDLKCEDFNANTAFLRLHFDISGTKIIVTIYGNK